MHLESAHHARRMGTSFLEENTVRAATAKQYMTIVEQFLSWSGITSLRGIRPKDLDEILVESFEEGYFAGQGAETADRTLAAIAYIEPSLDKKMLLRATRAAKGFRRLAPGASRQPLPWLALCGLLGAALWQQRVDLAEAMLVQFIAYLRPGELTSLRRRQLVCPLPNSGTVCWGLVLAPEVNDLPSKTGQRDESVLLDRFDPCILDHIFRKRLRLRPEASLWSFPPELYRQMFEETVAMAGLLGLAPHPYSLRHGGASHDALHKKRDMIEIQKRGRWRAEASVRRYQKETRAVQEVERMGDEARRYGVKIDRLLPKLFSASPCAVPRPPGAASQKASAKKAPRSRTARA